MKWHPSALGKLMTAPKLKSEVLSETAKSEIRRIAKEQFFGYSSTIVTKPMMKGKDWEHESIALVNQVRGTFFILASIALACTKSPPDTEPIAPSILHVIVYSLDLLVP